MNVEQFKRKMIAEVIEREGGSRYSNRPADLGGPTRWGVTQKTAREEVGYTGDMRNFPYELAYKVYEKFWDRCKCDLLTLRSHRLAAFVFDFGVNSGPSRASKVLQDLLNILNYREKWYKDIVADGFIGNLTMTALDAYIAKRGDFGVSMFEDTYNSERMSFLVNLARKRESQEENIYGWLTRCYKLEQQVL